MTKKPKNLLAVILAAGRGRRLEPITLTHSKAMTPILGVPIIRRLIEKIHNAGLKRFVVVRAPDDEELEALLRKMNGSDGIEVKTCVQKKPLGTADALLCARHLIDSDFLLSSCDNLFPQTHFQSLVDTFFEKNPSLVMTLCPIRPGDINRAAGVRLNGDEIIEIKEKPGENSGHWDAISKFLFVMDKAIMDRVNEVRESPRGERELQDAIYDLMRQFRPHRIPLGIFVNHYLHLTTAMDLIKIHEHYLSEHKPFTLHPEARLEGKVEIVEPVMVERGAVIGEGSVIGPMVYIGPDAMVGKNSILKNCIIYPRSVVCEKACLNSQVIQAR